MTMPTGATGLAQGNKRTGMGDVIPKGYRTGQLQQFTPEQMQLFQQLFSNLGQGSFLSQLAGGEEGAFSQLEAPALRQFNSLQGNIASRFSGMGSGARRSSGFANTLNQATSDFAQQLQSQRLGLQQQALRDLMGFSESLLGQRPQERTLIKKQMPFWQQLLLQGSDAAREVAVGAAKAAAAGA
jgi:hypothetical protein